MGGLTKSEIESQREKLGQIERRGKNEFPPSEMRDLRRAVR